MRPYAIVACALATALTLGSIDLYACGDKYMHVGRSARFGGYASIHRASILVYQPVKPDAKRKRELEDILTKAGHTVTFVQHGTDLAQAVAAYKYDLIITTYPDAAAVADRICALAAPPDILPTIYAPDDKASKLQDAEARKSFQWILAPYRMNKYDALEEIDDAMTARLKTLSPSGAAKK